MQTTNFASVKAPLFLTYLALVAVSLFYGVNYSILKIVVPEYLDPFGLIFYRVFISGAIFFIVYLFSGEKIDWKSDGLRILGCALTGVAVNMLMFYKGISLTSAVNGAILMTLTPVMVLVWAALLLGERITPLKMLGIISGMVGAIVIFYTPGYSLDTGHWLGDLLIVLNGMSYAAYLVLVKPLLKKYKPLTVMAWIFVIGAFLVLPVSLNPALAADFTSFPPGVWMSISYTILVVTVLVYILNAWTLQRVPASVVGSFIYLQPIFATFTAVLFFEEVFLGKHILAAFLIFTGVWLVTRPSYVAAPKTDKGDHP